MWILPDLVPDRPLVVFCGMAGARSSRSRDHYYEGVGNSFWESLHDSGLDGGRDGGRTAPLRAEDDHLLPSLGLGLTDLVRHRDPDWYEVDALVARIRAWEPEWVAFTSKTVAAAAARGLDERPPSLGVAPWDLAGASVFVLPGPSGANRRADYDGRPDRLSWWLDLAALVGQAE